MKSKPSGRDTQKGLFRVELATLVDLGYPLVELREKINITGPPLRSSWVNLITHKLERLESIHG